eukprot:TRINITY_DN1105_c0_g1_i2.p1 TRINITY_DN1105_c0_g1~~TRINITY_DN1105_c0_g1_i2.p1  ORF type:complete len:373 (-),score=71.38 TRINITY_DN1105_c0_g1_i2:321-1319(-)
MDSRNFSDYSSFATGSYKFADATSLSPARASRQRFTSRQSAANSSTFRRTSRRAFGGGLSPSRPSSEPRPVSSTSAFSASLHPSTPDPSSSSYSSSSSVRPHTGSRSLRRTALRNDGYSGEDMYAMGGEESLPPIYGLEDDAEYDVNGHASSSASYLDPYAEPSAFSDTAPTPSNASPFLASSHPHTPLAASRPSPTSPTPGVFSARSNAQSNAHWVTVYGFSAEKRDYVLMLFNQCGDIVEYETDDKGNWIHIRYKNNLDCSAALSKNGQQFDDLMIGVVVRSMQDKRSTPITRRESFVSSATSKARVLQQARACPRQSWWTKFLEYVFGL